jgi:acetolactate synthase-like protein
MNGGDLVAEVLERHGVRFVFTLCGGHISPILVGAKARGIRVVDTRHEATAVFAADAVARLTGIPGVAAVTAGPGVTNTITAVKNAQLAQSPVVVIGGATATMLSGRGALQDIDQMALFAPHTKLTTSVSRVRDIAPTLEQAFEIAAEGVPGPVFLELPVDLLYDESIVRTWYGAQASSSSKGLSGMALEMYVRYHLRKVFGGAGQARAGTPHTPHMPTPFPSAITRTAKSLAGAKKPVILVGSQATLGGPAEVERLAQAVRSIGAPVYLSGMARGLVGRDHDAWFRHKRKQALREADLVILAGVTCDFRLNYGLDINRKATLIAVNRSEPDTRKNRRPDLASVADPGDFLRKVGRELEGTTPDWRPWLDRLRTRDRERNEEIAEQAATVTELLNPLALCREIDDVMSDEGVIVADGGDFVATASYINAPRRPLSWLDPGPFGTLGVGAGFALAAKLCRPEAEVWAIYGDGSFGYSLAEFDTFARHRVPVIAVVGNDASWAQIARDQVGLLGDDVATVLARCDYHQAVRGLGAKGLLLDDPAKTDAVLSEAKRLAAQGHPVVVNAHIGKTDFRKGSISI